MVFKLESCTLVVTLLFGLESPQFSAYQSLPGGTMKLFQQFIVWLL